MSYIKAYEYESAVNPSMNQIPIVTKNSNDCTYGFHPIDLSSTYNMDFPCTSPNLLASFIRIKPLDTMSFFKNDWNDDIKKRTNASSHFFYVLQGTFCIDFNYVKKFNVSEGEILVLPGSGDLYFTNEGSTDVLIYYINDSPLINYLGCNSVRAIFEPSHYSREFIQENLHTLANPQNNRKGILFGNEDTEKIGNKTITPILWSLYNELPPHTNQRVHKHNSVALDLCINCTDSTNVYTLVGSELDNESNIVNPTKVQWKQGEMFITPPGLWHSHHNTGYTYAYILPIQDAGLLLYQRILGIELK
jgi:gentisate 1,2-dioxygenase